MPYEQHLVSRYTHENYVWFRSSKFFSFSFKQLISILIGFAIYMILKVFGHKRTKGES